MYNAQSYMSKSLILAVRRTHVKHELCIWPSSPQVQRSSVVRASDRCTVGHIGSIPVGDSDFFFLSRAREMLITDLISSPNLKFIMRKYLCKRGKYVSFT